MRSVTLLILAAPLLLLIGCAASQEALRFDSPYRDPTALAKGQIAHLATGRLLAEPELYDYLARFPVVHVGESHDSADDHAVELSILKGLSERLPGKLALGLEMLQKPWQAQVDAYVAGELSEKDFHRVWSKNWSDFPYYREILRYARDQKIPVVALNAGKALKEAVRQKGLAGLDADMAKEIPEMDLEDPHHRAFTEAIFEGHGQGSKDFEAFYRVQVLWDETMAQSAADFLRSTSGSGRHLVVMAGGNHVRFGFGIPRRLFRRVPVPYCIVEPYVNPTLVEVPEEKLMDVDIPELPLRPADIYWSVDYRDLRDNQVKLGVMIEDVPGKGVEVKMLLPDAPAQKAGILQGDRITAVDGVEIKEMADVTYQVGLHQPGDVGPVEVARGDQRLTLQLTYEVPKHGK